MRDLALFDLFDHHIRAKGVGAGSATLVRCESVLLQKGAGSTFVGHWQLTPDVMPDIVAQLSRKAIDEKHDLVWRLYDCDGPAGLEGMLRLQGFRSSSPGSLVAKRLSDASDGAANDIRIVEVADRTTAVQYLEVSALAFGTSLPSEAAAEAMLTTDRGRHLVAFVGDDAAAVGCLNLRRGNPAALLSGGAVHPDFKGRGLYRALIHHRLRLALEHNATVVFCEARQTSAPILLGLGFDQVAQEKTWVLKATGEGHQIKSGKGLYRQDRH